jgi:tetratricopeptide (TPR) repeat protein
MRLKKYDQAINKFHDAIKYSKRDMPDIYNNLGICLMEKGRPVEAIDAFRKVISLTPYSAEARDNLGMGLLKAGQSDEAILRLKEAIRLNDKYAKAYYHLYLGLDSKGCKNEAIVYFNKAQQLQPELKMESK